MKTIMSNNLNIAENVTTCWRKFREAATPVFDDLYVCTCNCAEQEENVVGCTLFSGYRDRLDQELTAVRLCNPFCSYADTALVAVSNLDLLRTI